MNDKEYRFGPKARGRKRIGLRGGGRSSPNNVSTYE
jgi:hypothetical protein